MGLRKGGVMRYISNQSISFSICLNGKDNSVRVSFIPLSSGGSTYMTDNEALIAALEKSDMFNKVYRRAPECVNEEAKPKRAAKKAAEKKLTQVAEVEGWQDAVEYLTDKCGSDASKLISPEAILNEAQAKGLAFPNLK